MSIQRRSFMAGILAAGFAPASIRSGVLMPVRSIVPAGPWWISYRLLSADAWPLTGDPLPLSEQQGATCIKVSSSKWIIKGLVT